MKTECTCGYEEQRQRVKKESLVNYHKDSCPYLGVGGRGCPVYGSNDCEFCPLRDSMYKAMAVSQKAEEDKEHAAFEARCDKERAKHIWEVKR